MDSARIATLQAARPAYNDLKDTLQMGLLTWRDLRRSDLSEAFTIQPSSVGDDVVGRLPAMRIWQSFFQHPAFRGIVVESDPPIGGHRIVAVGAGIFVTANFVAAEVANPRTGLNARVITSIARGLPLLLEQKAIGTANAGRGIDVVNLLGSWLPQGLDRTQVAGINALFAESFLQKHRGYRLFRLLREAIGEAEVEFVRSSGIFRIIHEDRARHRAITLMTRDDAFAVPHSMATRIFEYRPPVLRLIPSHQQLLTAAIKGRTDDELCAELSLSGPTIKKRWLAIFDRIAQAKPDLFAAEPKTDRTRGVQKRHRVLAYIREHPEELQPFNWKVHRPNATGRQRSPN